MSTISCRWRRRGLRTMWTNRKNVWEQKKRREWGMNMCSAWFLKHLDKLRRIWLSKVFFKVKLILSINWYLELIWDIYVDTWGGNTFTNLCDLRLYRHSVEQGGCCHVDSTQSFSQRASQWSDDAPFSPFQRAGGWNTCRAFRAGAPPLVPLHLQRGHQLEEAALHILFPGAFVGHFHCRTMKPALVVVVEEK